jgi:hypothetical protein
MTAQQIAQLGLDAVGSSVAVAIITQLLKQHPTFPLEEGQKLRIRAFATLLSACSVVLLGVAQGSLSAADVQNVLAALITTATAAFGAHAVYKIAKDAEK